MTFLRDWYLTMAPNGSERGRHRWKVASLLSRVLTSLVAGVSTGVNKKSGDNLLFEDMEGVFDESQYRYSRPHVISE